MDDIYAAGPTSAPAELTQPTPAYTQRVWLAVVGLGAFVALYFALTGWFVWTAARLCQGVAEGDGGLLGILAAACAVFFSIFMLKGLFFFKRGKEESADLEITAAEQPQLFAFLYRLADEARAPRPHRVFVSPRVNAAVYYDLNLLNLLLPSKKNLEIGLALVNVLTLGELKAVLAHEFGHFAQRSMAVGRWVYIAQQVAAQIIFRRDALDSFLRQLTRIDIRIAWLGWLLQLIVWSIRSLLESLFRVVVLAQRALSREMELQADLVAVSLTGSNALIHALHRIGVADEAWTRTLNFAGGELNQERPVMDLFSIQTRVIEQLRKIFDQPNYGQVPPLPETNREHHRVFKMGLAAPPRMWATHPANTEREKNAKRIYLDAPNDDRSAWTLFVEPEALRRTLSLRLAPKRTVEPVAITESIARLDAEFSRAHLDRRYRGVYLNRSVVRHTRSTGELYAPAAATNDLLAELAALYPDSLTEVLERSRTLTEEKQALEAIHDGHAKVAEGTLQYRGATLKRSQLPMVIAQVGAELNQAQQTLAAHDARCRAAHLAAAQQVGGGWAEYLRGLAGVLHYAEHTEADLNDARGHLSNVYAVVTADGRVSTAERTRLVRAAHQLYEALRGVWTQSNHLVLDPMLCKRLNIERWDTALGDMSLPPPDQTNIGDWLGVIDGWVNNAINGLSQLRAAALEHLLEGEVWVGDSLRKHYALANESSFDGLPHSAEDEIRELQIERPNASSIEAAVAPAPQPVSRPPQQYPVLVPGSERQRQKRLHWWDRFVIADGWFGSVARLTVALGIVGGIMFFGGQVGDTAVTVFNGLATPVHVSIGPETINVEPLAHRTVTLAPASHYLVSATTAQGAAIESFDTDAHISFAHYIYNVAGAAPLVQWTAVYGSYPHVPERTLGNTRWSTSNAEIRFEDPPEKISTKSGGGTKSVLSAFANLSPGEQLNLLGDDPGPQAAFIASHARWDQTNSRYIFDWLARARGQSTFNELIALRLHDAPHDAVLLRVQQDSATGPAYKDICATDAALAQANPTDGTLQYLAARCTEDADQRDQALVDLYRRWPENAWLQMAAGYVAAEHAQWPDAANLLDRARRELPPMSTYLTVDLYRIDRLLGRDSKATTAELSRSSDLLKMTLQMETGEGVGNSPYQAYHELAGGHLDAALRQAGTGTPTAARVLRLAAASDGATDSLVQKALLLPADQGLDAETAWSALGLALRLHRDPAPYVAVITQNESGRIRHVDRALQFVKNAKSGLSTAATETMLKGLTPELRGQAYSAAAIALGPAAPADWRKIASKLLFASERPSFH